MSDHTWTDYLPTPAGFKRNAAGVAVALVAAGSVFCTLIGATPVGPGGIEWRIVWAGAGAAFFGGLTALIKNPNQVISPLQQEALDKIERGEPFTFDPRGDDDPPND